MQLSENPVWSKPTPMAQDGFSWPDFGMCPYHEHEYEFRTAKEIYCCNHPKWERGLYVRQDALVDGEAISLHSEAEGGGHRIQWADKNNVPNTYIRSTTTDSTLWDINRNTGNLTISIDKLKIWNFQYVTDTTGGLNFVSGDANPMIEAIGDEDNIDLVLKPKGPEGAIVLSSEGVATTIKSVGDEDNIDLVLKPKGPDSAIVLWSEDSTSEIKVDGDVNDIDLSLKPKGAGLPQFHSFADPVEIAAAFAGSELEGIVTGGLYVKDQNGVVQLLAAITLPAPAPGP